MDNKHTGISDPNLHTFTGIPAGEIPARLAEPFDDPRAYKGVPGGADLTDISTGHMLERITQVFGPKGLGWNFLFNKEDVEIGSPVDKRVLVRLKYALFQYTLFGAEGQPQVFEIVTSGANTNSLEYAEEGARTSALGAAIKGLCFQLPVYKGLLDHHNVEQYLAGGATKQPSGGSETSTGNGKVRSAAAKAGPAAAEAAEPEPAPQLAAQPGNGGSVHPGEFVINVGTKYRGKKVRELAENVLAWFANLEGVRASLFPRLASAYAAWCAGDQGAALRDAVSAGAGHWSRACAQMLQMHRTLGDDAPAQIERCLQSPDWVLS